VVSAVAETTLPIARAVANLVVRLEFEALVAECWLAGGWSFVQVVEGDVVFVGRALSSSHHGHVSAMNWGTRGRLQINVVENARGEPRVDQVVTGLEQCVVVHPNVLFQGLEACCVRCAPGSLGSEAYNFRGDAWVTNGVDMLVHQLLEVGLGMQHMEVVVTN